MIAGLIGAGTRDLGSEIDTAEDLDAIRREGSRVVSSGRTVSC